MRYELSNSEILAAINNNRRLAKFWENKGYPTIAQTHNDNVRDLRIVLLNSRFPNNTLPVHMSADFTPVVVVTPDTVSDSDAAAFADAIEDYVAESDKASELSNA